MALAGHRDSGGMSARSAAWVDGYGDPYCAAGCARLGELLFVGSEPAPVMACLGLIAAACTAFIGST